MVWNHLGATDIGTKMGCLKTKYVERRGCFGIDDRPSIELPSIFGKEKNLTNRCILVHSDNFFSESLI